MRQHSQRIGGPGTVVEIDESHFGRRKYNRGRPQKDVWVFGGVERGAGRTFLVPVSNRSADTLTAVIHGWILPGTTIVSDCWASYRHLSDEGFVHDSVNHTICLVDKRSDQHRNTIEGTWRHVKAFLNRYNRQSNYI
jgi:transposase-like protein